MKRKTISYAATASRMPIDRFRKRFDEIFVKRADTNSIPTTKASAVMLMITLNTSNFDVISATIPVSPNVKRNSSK